jgi:hypothetical protein
MAMKIDAATRANFWLHPYRTRAAQGHSQIRLPQGLFF